MPIEIYWQVPQRVLYVHYSSHMTVQDIRDSIDQMRERFEEGEGPVHVILDIGDVTVFFFSLIALAIACGLAWLMVWSFRSQ